MKIGPRYYAVVRKRLNNRSKLDTQTGCKLWTGPIDKDGYGYTSFFNKTVRVHRLAMHLYNDFDLSSNLQINHKDNCKHKNCMEITHLYAGTNSENMNDSVRAGTHINSQKSHCPRGHLYDKIVWFRGKKLRRCSTCVKASDKRKYQRRKGLKVGA